MSFRRYSPWLLSALAALCGCHPLTAPDSLSVEEWKKNLPLERLARDELFDWDTFLNRMRSTRDLNTLIEEEVAMQRSFTNYDKGLAMRYPAGDKRAFVAITNFDRELNKIGVDLVVVWVPNPIDLAAAELSKGAVPEAVSIQPELTEFFIDLAEANVDLLDLRPAFRRASVNPETDPFEQWDHHWSSAGVKLAADLVVDRISKYGIESRQTDQFEHRPREIQKDTSSEEFLPSGFDPGTQTVDEVLYRGKPLGSTPGGPVLVLGDSMVSHLSKEKPHGVAADFTAQLRARLGAPLTWQNRNGGAQLAPVDFIRDHLAREDRLPEVVVWVLSGNFFRPGSWPVMEFPTGSELESMREQNRNTATSAFVAMVKANIVTQPELDLGTLLAESDYPHVAVASQLSIVASLDETAPDNGTEAVIYQWVMKDRHLIPDVPLSPAKSTWMWLQPLDPSDPIEARIFRDEEFPIDLPRYWRID